MFQILNTLIQSFSFESREMKAAYHRFNKEAEKKLLGLVQIIVTLFFIILTIVGIFIKVQLKEMLIRAAFIIASIVIFLIRLKSAFWYKITLTALGGAFMYYVMVFVSKIFDKASSQPNEQSAFLSGNGIGMLEMIFVLSFKNLWFRSITYIILVAIQTGTLSDSIFSQPRVYVQFFVTVVQMFVFCLYQDLMDRRNFSIIYQSREKLRKFQDLLSNDLPSSVMIMASDLTSVLYSNKFFQRKFARCESLKTSQQIISDLFSKLIIEQDSQTTEIITKPAVSLFDYLKDLPFELMMINNKEADTLHAFSHDDDGKELYYEVRLRSIMWDGIPSYAIVMNDVSDKQMIAALKIADEHKDRVIATVSHELRTPINGILGLLEMATDRTVDRTLIGYLDYCKAAASYSYTL